MERPTEITLEGDGDRPHCPECLTTEGATENTMAGPVISFACGCVLHWPAKYVLDRQQQFVALRICGDKGPSPNQIHRARAPQIIVPGR